MEAIRVVGGKDSWRSFPWLVVMYGIVLASLAVTGIALVLTEMFLVHVLCALCLLSAAISLVKAPLVRDEGRASLGVLEYALTRRNTR